MTSRGRTRRAQVLAPGPSPSARSRVARSASFQTFASDGDRSLTMASARVRVFHLCPQLVTARVVVEAALPEGLPCQPLLDLPGRQLV